LFFDKKKREQSFREKAILYKTVFSSPDGKLVLYDLMDRNFIARDFDGKSDAFEVAKQCGQRKAILDILYYCDISIKQLDEMMKGDEQ